MTLTDLEIDLVENYRQLTPQSKDNINRLIDIYSEVDKKNEKAEE